MSKSEMTHKERANNFVDKWCIDYIGENASTSLRHSVTILRDRLQVEFAKIANDELEARRAIESQLAGMTTGAVVVPHCTLDRTLLRVFNPVRSEWASIVMMHEKTASTTILENACKVADETADALRNNLADYERKSWSTLQLETIARMHFAEYSKSVHGCDDAYSGPMLEWEKQPQYMRDGWIAATAAIVKEIRMLTPKVAADMGGSK